MRKRSKTKQIKTKIWR